MGIFQFLSDSAGIVNKVISADTVTDVVDATETAVIVPWFQVNEKNGGTQNLTVELYDVANTTSYYLGDDSGATWVAKAVTAKQSVLFSQGLTVPKGWKLRVTSSDASGHFHVIGTQRKSR